MFKYLLKKYRVVEVFMVAILLGATLLYESIHVPRAYAFASGYFSFAVLILYRMKSKKNLKSLMSYLVSIALVMFLEYNSRYIINYFIHILYILLLLELTVTLTDLKQLWLGAAIVIAGMYKYIILINYKPAISTYAEAIFFLLLNLMSLFVITLMHGLREEQEKLIEANKKLEAYSLEVESLTEIKTRAEIAGKIHDGIGHNLTALIMQLEMTSHMLKSDSESATKLLEDAKATARQNLVEVRKAVKTMDMTTEQEDIEQLIRKFSIQTGVKISWEIGDIFLQQDVQACVFSIVQEGLTNAVRHGHATAIEVVVADYQEPGNLIVTIKDNGQPPVQIETGYGLTKMKERIEALGGTLELVSADGFTIQAILPNMG